MKRDIPSEPAEPSRVDGVPLFVDLDGTLVRTDTRIESALARVRRRPLRVETLPYHEELLTFLRNESAAGRKLVLVAGADRRIAVAIAEHLGVFSDVIVAEGQQPGKGSARLAAIRKNVGDRPFDYAGGSPSDLPIWSQARRCIVAGRSRRLVGRVQGTVVLERVFDPVAADLRSILHAIRIHQWIKSALVFVPALLAHRVDPPLLMRGLAAFFSLSLLASCVYLINDLVDLESDRRHPTKRQRPLAAGRLPLATVALLAPALVAGAVALAALLPIEFAVVLFLYFALTTSYSLHLKRVVLVDVLMLSGLYTIRIIAGAMATGVSVSEWLLAFSMFFFLSLAFVKRYSELAAMRETNRAGSSGRGYVVKDLEVVGTMGVASGYLAILVMALWANSNTVVALYTRPGWLWIVCLLLLYWISRVWLLTYREQMNDDPVLFALTDWQSYVVGLAALVTVFVAIRT